MNASALVCSEKQTVERECIKVNKLIFEYDWSNPHYCWNIVSVDCIFVYMQHSITHLLVSLYAVDSLSHVSHDSSVGKKRTNQSSGSIIVGSFQHRIPQHQIDVHLFLESDISILEMITSRLRLPIWTCGHFNAADVLSGEAILFQISHLKM